MKIPMVWGFRWQAHFQINSRSSQGRLLNILKSISGLSKVSSDPGGWADKMIEDWRYLLCRVSHFCCCLCQTLICSLREIVNEGC